MSAARQIVAKGLAESTDANTIVNNMLEDRPTPKKTLARWASMDQHEAAVEQAGGKHITVPLNRGKFNAHLAAYAPGCGAPTPVEGTNGGTVPCGAQVTQMGKTAPYFCAACHDQLQQNRHE